MEQKLPVPTEERSLHDMQELVGKLCQRVEKLESDRNVWNRLWQDIADFVLPRRGKMYYESKTAGSDLSLKIYDSTAPWALEQLASGLHSYLTSPNQRWFTLTLPPELQTMYENNQEITGWLEVATNRMYEIFNSSKSNFIPQAHELFLDLGSFGTAVMYTEEDYDSSPVRFCTYHLASCCIDEDAYGRVDTIGRKFKLEARQALALWPDFPSVGFMRQAMEDPLSEHEFIHFVGPRKDFDPDSPLPKKFRYGSWYLYPSEKLILSESGYREFPFLVPRWSKLTGEKYGRSPAMTMLPDIRMINSMAYSILKAAQKINDPPLMLPDEGFMLPIKTSPGSLIFYDSSLGADKLITPLETKGRPDIGLDMMESRRQAIVRGFYVDWMNLQEGPQMTATEVNTRMQEKMRLMGPAVSRLQSEFLDPLLDRVFAILLRKGMLPEVPRELDGVELRIEYVSPMVKAQKMGQVQTLQQFLEVIGPLAQIKPEMLDKLNPDGIVDFVSKVMDMSQQMMLPQQVVDQMRQSRAEQQQQMAQSEQMSQQAGASAQLAEANLRTAQAQAI
jgi:hypothetical protein